MALTDTKLCRSCFSRMERIWSGSTHFYWKCESCECQSELKEGKRQPNIEDYEKRFEEARKHR